VRSPCSVSSGSSGARRPSPQEAEAPEAPAEPAEGGEGGEGGEAAEGGPVLRGWAALRGGGTFRVGPKVMEMFRLTVGLCVRSWPRFSIMLQTSARRGWAFLGRIASVIDVLMMRAPCYLKPYKYVRRALLTAMLLLVSRSLSVQVLH